ncbi:MAG TPA: NAD(P)-dependent alcohol dehydrogenase [Chthoniobacterales bacterium]|jgi:NADPH:quinone reductase-like Zn-dependent oxidoreductase|nr:NAD(P)-dependent alcohol dehydrogenase [Chthoniobacterales bacterium]
MRVRRIVKWTVVVIFLGIVGLITVSYWISTNDCDQKAGLPSHPMKAIRYCEFGSPEDVLKLEEIEKPVPNDNQVLVRVRAAALNPLDLATRRPLWVRVLTGRRKPKETRLGVDYAGTVEAVGKNVTQFKRGDEVFGGRLGAYGEYVCIAPDRAVMLKPANVTFEQAASVPVAALTALQGLRDKGHIQPGQKVLINGASGGVGTFAVQIAKSFGAEVTAVTSSRNVDLIRSIGADHVIDYTKEDFTKTDQRYDLIYDIVNNHSFAERRQILTPKGICVMVGFGGSGWHDETWGRLGGALSALVRSWFVSQKFGIFLANLNKPDLKVLADLMQSGKITPVIDRTYKLNEVPQALTYLEQGHARGKVVVTVE